MVRCEKNLLRAFLPNKIAASNYTRVQPIYNAHDAYWKMASADKGELPYLQSAFYAKYKSLL